MEQWLFRLFNEFEMHPFSVIFQGNLSLYSSTKNSHWLDTHLKDGNGTSVTMEMEQGSKFIGSADVTTRALLIQYVFQPC